MPYSKQTWSDNPADNTPLSAARLNHMEDGIASAETSLGPDSVTNEMIQTSAVTTTKLNNGAVTTDKIASSAVSSTQLASNAVTSIKLASGAVRDWHIADSAVEPNHLRYAPAASGQYQGDGAWNRQIVIGFVPAFISIQAHGLYDTWQCWAGSSVEEYQAIKIDGSSSTRSIQREIARTSSFVSVYIQLVSTVATYFRINGEGVDPDMNLSGRWYSWYAIGIE